MKRKYQDYIGERFGRLVVESFSLDEKKQGWMRCKCDCGNYTTMLLGNLKKVVSCGCYRREVHTKHGLAHTPEYKVWVSMIQRCANPNCEGFAEYGAKGITVAKSWLKFENFIRDMGRRPPGRMTIERKDGTRGYNKRNCRWATFSEQSHNLRTNFVVMYKGERKVLTDLVGLPECAVSISTLRKRLLAKWPVERALTIPAAMLGRKVWAAKQKRAA